MSDQDEFFKRVVETLKEPVRIDPALDRRVMAEIETMPVGERLVPRGRSLWAWFTEKRTISVSPIAGLAMAASVAVLLVVGARALVPSPEPQLMVSSTPAVGTNAIQFVLVAPDAGSVSLVGDFNDWDVAATPLLREEGDGVWSVTVPLTPGRYRYSFLIDGTTWQRDPLAARTIEDEFGRPNSVLTIGGA